MYFVQKTIFLKLQNNHLIFFILIIRFDPTSLLIRYCCFRYSFISCAAEQIMKRITVKARKKRVKKILTKFDNYRVFNRVSLKQRISTGFRGRYFVCARIGGRGFLPINCKNLISQTRVIRFSISLRV